MYALILAVAAVLYAPQLTHPHPTVSATVAEVAGVVVYAHREAAERHPDAKAPIGDGELAAVLRDGHEAVFGYPAPRRRLAGVWALARLEGSRVGICNGNLGSIHAGKGQPYCFHGGYRFAWAANHREHAERLWRLLRDHYRGALAWWDAGDVDAAARSLARAGYHRTDAAVYGRGLRTLTFQFWRDAEPSLR